MKKSNSGLFAGPSAALAKASGASNASILANNVPVSKAYSNMTEKEWIEYFEERFSQYPEAMKAMSTMNSKLYKAVK